MSRISKIIEFINESENVEISEEDKEKIDSMTHEELANYFMDLQEHT